MRSSRIALDAKAKRSLLAKICIRNNLDLGLTNRITILSLVMFARSYAFFLTFFEMSSKRKVLTFVSILTLSFHYFFNLYLQPLEYGADGYGVPSINYCQIVF